MKTHSFMLAHNAEAVGFDLVRVSRAKETVDLCANTIRAYHAEGLSIYRRGRATFFSKTELAHFIRSRSISNTATAGGAR